MNEIKEIGKKMESIKTLMKQILINHNQKLKLLRSDWKNIKL